VPARPVTRMREARPVGPWRERRKARACRRGHVTSAALVHGHRSGFRGPGREAGRGRAHPRRGQMTARTARVRVVDLRARARPCARPGVGSRRCRSARAGPAVFLARRMTGATATTRLAGRIVRRVRHRQRVLGRRQRPGRHRERAPGRTTDRGLVERLGVVTHRAHGPARRFLGLRPAHRPGPMALAEAGRMSGLVRDPASRIHGVTARTRHGRPASQVDALRMHRVIESPGASALLGVRAHAEQQEPRRPDAHAQPQRAHQNRPSSIRRKLLSPRSSGMVTSAAVASYSMRSRRRSPSQPSADRRPPARSSSPDRPSSE